MTTATGARAPLPSIAAAEVLLPCPQGTFAPTLAFFQELGFAVATISPADSPTHATLTAYGLRIRLHPSSDSAPPPTLRLLRSDLAEFGGAPPSVTAPNGVVVLFSPLETVFPIDEGGVLGGPSQDDWVLGRAGMAYRDLLPGRMGGRLIASHIRVASGGPVPDYVHFHNVQFQIIYVVKGWVELVYEDCGPAFIAREGDLVLQPPRIRHRVLTASDGLEVVELAKPASHETHADLGMPLPNSHLPLLDREWSGQRFVHHVAASSTSIEIGGLLRTDLGLSGAASGFILSSLQSDGGGGSGTPVEVERRGAVFFFAVSGLWRVGETVLSQDDALTVVEGTLWVAGEGRLLCVSLLEL